MQRQPRTPQEAAMLDPMGLLSFPSPNIPRGLFGASSRRTPPIGGFRPRFADQANQPLDMTGAPPPIDQAPPPPANWQQTLGPELMAQLPKALAQTSGQTRVANGDTTQPLETSPLMPAPPMRGGMIASGPKYPMPPGMFGQSAPTVGAAAMSDKIGNRGAPLPMDANGNGKKGFDWRMLAGVVGDALLGLNGQAPLYAQNMWKLRQQQQDHNDRLAQMREQTRLKLSEPDFATVNNRRVRIDPATGRADVLYTAPSEAEDYAARFGVPGSDAYNIALQDYVLKYSGPTATDLNIEEEDNRQDNRVALEGVRQNNRIGLEGVRHGNRVSLRGMPTYRDSHPRPRSAGGSSSGGRGGTQEGATATNPRTGEKVVYRGGKWVPAR